MLCSHAVGRAVEGLEQGLSQQSADHRSPPASSKDGAVQPVSTVPWRAGVCTAVAAVFGYWTWSGIPWLTVLGLGGAAGCWILLEGIAPTTVLMVQPPHRDRTNIWHYRIKITDPNGTHWVCDRTFNDFRWLETALLPMCIELNLPIATRQLPSCRGVASSMSTLSEADARDRGEQIAAWVRRLLLDRRLVAVCSSQIDQFLNPEVTQCMTATRGAGSGSGRDYDRGAADHDGGRAVPTASGGGGQSRGSGDGRGGGGGDRHSGSISIRKDSFADKMYTMIAGPEDPAGTEEPLTRNRSSSDPGTASEPGSGALRLTSRTGEITSPAVPALVRLSNVFTLATQCQENLELDRAQRLYTEAAEGYSMVLGDDHSTTVRARHFLAGCEAQVRHNLRDSDEPENVAAFEDAVGGPLSTDELLQGGWFQEGGMFISRGATDEIELEAMALPEQLGDCD